MALSPSSLLRGITSRILPQANIDSPQIDVPSRFGRYGENYVLSMVRKQHMLADEGAYFTTNNNSQSGILSNGASAFAATLATALIFNSDVSSNPAYKRIYIDYVNLVTTVIGQAASGLVNLQGALYIDNTNRYSAGGSNLTANIITPNMDISKNSVANVYFGNITAAVATGAVRAVSPLRVIRTSVSGTALDVVGEVKLVNFGGVEGSLGGSMVAANANFIPVPMPPVILGPQQCALFYLWQNNGSTNTAATYAPEFGWWER